MGRTKILLIEDDANINRLIADFMTSRGYDVTTFADGLEALEYVQMRGLPHIALVDLTLPTIHGFEVSGRLKSMADVPIIFITATSDTETIVTGLRKYAEDFIVKPFELLELEARIQVVLARMPSLDYASEPIVRVDDFLSVDFAHNRLVLNGKAHSLTPTESVLLHVLMRSAARVLDNRMLIARVWPDEEVFEDTLRVHMHRLRRKLENDSHHPHYIRTERGVGYTFTVRPQDALDFEDEDEVPA
jgi:DNA-binding response OmpR family regulator